MIYKDTQEFAKAVWSETSVSKKQEISRQMVESLTSVTPAKRMRYNNTINLGNANKIDQLVSDITLVGYGLRVK